MVFRRGYGSNLPPMVTLESYGHVCVVSSLWKRYGRSWKKTMWSSDAEHILIKTGLCKQGTANKGFASAGDYYQSMREQKLLGEAMANLHRNAFEQ